MAPRTRADFVLVRLKYMENIPPRTPRCVTASNRPVPSRSVNDVSEWFRNAMEAEKGKLPRDMVIQFSEWHINTNNAKVFTVNRCRYDKIMMMMGEDTLYWVYYKDVPAHGRIEGRVVLPQMFCGCCINKEYVNMLALVKHNNTGILG